MSKPPIDYQTMLRKYIVYVRDCTGSDYIASGYRGYRGDTIFTPDEWADLEHAAWADEGAA